MFCPTSAKLLHEQINSLYSDIKLHTDKLESLVEDNDSMVVYHCVSYYQRSSEGKIEENRKILSLEPLSLEEAIVLSKEINKVKDLPNVDIKTYQEALVEEISKLKNTLTQLEKL